MRYLLLLLLVGCATFPPCKDFEGDAKKECLVKEQERQERIDRLHFMGMGRFR